MSTPTSPPVLRQFPPVDSYECLSCIETARSMIRVWSLLPRLFRWNGFASTHCPKCGSLLHASIATNRDLVVKRVQPPQQGDIIL